MAGVTGVLGTSAFYLALVLVQIENAGLACESPQASVPGLEIEDTGDIRFENSFLNLGGRCTYRLDDGSVVVTREPGWWFPATIVGFMLMLSGPASIVARRKGRSGVLFGLIALVAPPLALTLSLTAAQRPPVWGGPLGAGCLVTYIL